MAQKQGGQRTVVLISEKKKTPISRSKDAKGSFLHRHEASNTSDIKDTAKSLADPGVNAPMQLASLFQRGTKIQVSAGSFRHPLSTAQANNDNDNKALATHTDNSCKSTI